MSDAIRVIRHGAATAKTNRATQVEAMVRLVVTDLDNTLYNWVDYFVPSFTAMLDQIVRITGLDTKLLRESFRRVYQRRGTTEYAFAIEELDVLESRNSGRTVAQVLTTFDSAIKAFRQTRKRTLHLYPGVVSTLQRLRAQGKIIAAHTDAMMFYAEARLKQLDVEALFDAVVAQKDHGVPSRARMDEVRYYRDSKHYTSAIPLKRALPAELLKPNPLCLRDIMLTFGVSPEETIYVGDSLRKDIRMAQECGVHDVYAAYGRDVNPDNYQQLLQITHWTEADIQRDEQARSVLLKPTFVIDRFDQLLDVVEHIEGKR